MSGSAKARRFPYVAAALCAACVIAAVWTWMRYSYAWPTTPEDVSRELTALAQRDTKMGRHSTISRSGITWTATLPEPYLAVRGTIIRTAVGQDGTVYGKFGPEYDDIYDHIIVILAADAAQPYSGVERAYVGRLRYEGMHYSFVHLDTTATRFTGASIAGLAVGAMGVFVFAIALRHWLGERGRIAGGENAT